MVQLLMKEKCEMPSIQRIAEVLERRIGKVEVVFTMPDRPYSEKEKKVMERAANTCPVHLSLHPDVEQVFTFKWRQ